MTTTAHATTNTFDTLHRAYECLAGVCDFASTQDGKGFNGGDAKFGHEIAQHPLSRWTPEITRTAWEVALKYQAQIGGFGIEWQSIPEPPMPETPGYKAVALGQRRALKEARVNTSSRVISLLAGGKSVALSFTYNAGLVAEIKALPSRKWNGDARLWEASLAAAGNAAAIFAFARQHDFVVDDEAQSALQTALDTASANPAPEISTERRIVLSSDGGSLEFWFPNDVTVRDAVKLLSGRRFDADGPCWRVPVDASHAAAITAVANDFGFSFSETAQAALSNAHVAVAQALLDSRAEDADFDVAGLGGTLRTFQRAGVKYLHEHRRCFLADDMGTGKSFQALAAFKANDGKKCLVICPASVKLNWVKEVYTFLPGFAVTVLNGKSSAALSVRVKGETLPVSTNDMSAAIVIVNYDILTKNLPALMAAEFDHLIVDESHYCKDAKAARTAAVTQIASGMRKDKATKKRVRVAAAVPNVYLLSGTPLLNRPIELVPQLEALDMLDRFGGFMPFAKRYCEAHQTSFGWDMTGAANMGELNEKLRTFGYIRRTKSQVLKELPAKQRITVPVEIDNRKEYNSAETDLIAYLVDAVTKDKAFYASLGGMTKEQREAAITARQADVAYKASAAEHLVRINTLKQIAVRGKMETVKEWVRDFLATGEKLVIFGWYRETVEALAKEFGAPTIMGGDTAASRQATVDRFQSDPECRVIVCNIIAAGEGITLTAASTTLFMELGWNPGKMNQAEDRVHRIGQQASSVTAYYLLGQNTIEEKIAELIESKRVVTDGVIEGEGGGEQGNGILKDLVEYLIDKKASR
jgi:superfamily II DNA or RNA helicase